MPYSLTPRSAGGPLMMTTLATAMTAEALTLDWVSGLVQRLFEIRTTAPLPVLGHRRSLQSRLVATGDHS